MTIDFQEELNISRSKDNQGNPRLLPLYDFAWTKTDLADDTVTIEDWDTDITLGEACDLIDRFGGSELTIKARIKHFLEHDTISLVDEY